MDLRPPLFANSYKSKSRFYSAASVPAGDNNPPPPPYTCSIQSFLLASQTPPAQLSETDHAVSHLPKTPTTPGNTPSPPLLPALPLPSDLPRPAVSPLSKPGL